MTPQERQLIDDLFDRLGKLESAPRDPDAVAAISQGLRQAPNAVYALVQTVLLQDEALKRANARIEELQNPGAPQQNQSGGFLDSMRDALFGQNQNQPHTSVPNVSAPNARPAEAASRPVWNSGQVLPQSGSYDQHSYGQPAYGQSSYGQPSYGQPSFGQPYGAPQAPMGGGGSFLGTAAAAAAGVVGGSLLLGGIRSMMGGAHQAGFADAGRLVDGSSGGPWSSDLSNSDLARDAGINDIGTGSRTGLLDSASNDVPDNDVDVPDNDATDLDSDDFGGNDNGSDYA
jgi:uncharacterized protein